MVVLFLNESMISSSLPKALPLLRATYTPSLENPRISANPSPFTSTICLGLF